MKRPSIRAGDSESRTRTPTEDALSTFLASMELLRETPGGIGGLSAACREAAANEDMSAELMAFWIAFARLAEAVDREGLGDD